MSRHAKRLVEESEDLATNLLAVGLIVVHDTLGGGEDHVSELAGWEKVGDPLLEVLGTRIQRSGFACRTFYISIRVWHALMLKLDAHARKNLLRGVHSTRHRHQ